MIYESDSRIYWMMQHVPVDKRNRVAAQAQKIAKDTIKFEDVKQAKTDVENNDDQ